MEEARPKFISDTALGLRIWVCAYSGKNPIGFVGISSPNFLAIDYIVVAIAYRCGFERGKIGATARFGIALAPPNAAIANFEATVANSPWTSCTTAICSGCRASYTGFKVGWM